MSVQSTRAWQRLALAAALNLVVGGVAAAQTLIVRGVPAGSTVELVVNSAPAGKATADARGDATLFFDLATHAGKPEMDAHVYAETCGELRRVYVIETGLQPGPRADECERREITGVFFVRRVSTLVVNLAGANPTMLLVRGSYDLSPRDPSKIVTARRTGIVIFGGGGISKFRDVEFVACGDVSDCSGNDWRTTATAGAEVWFRPFLAAHFAYVKPLEVEIRGSGDNFRFTSGLDAHVMSIAGKVGIPVGRVRIFGQFGTTYHRATFSTSQTNDDQTVTIDGVSQTIRGGTQTFELKTKGWGWTFGGGVEVWLKQRFGIYGEASRLRLKGNALDDAEGLLDDYMMTFVAGARFRIGGR